MRSLSSLLKQYNTLESERAVRVIDYNDMVERKLAELARIQNGGEEPGTAGFQSLDSIAAETVREDPAEICRRQRMRQSSF